MILQHKNFKFNFFEIILQDINLYVWELSST
jgi:hypothetical protein